MEQPHLLTYTLSLQRSLPWNILGTAAFAGSRGLDLMRTLEANPILPQIVNGQEYWPGTWHSRESELGLCRIEHLAG